MIKRIAVLFALLLSCAAHAQVTGPTTRTPRLTVNPGPTVVENLTINGTCTGCLTGAGANPTAQVGLTTVNGVATTLMRSDGAPALSQSIAPTWTAQHIFNIPPIVQGTGPRYDLDETDGAANNRRWQVAVNGEQLLWRVANDALSATTNFLTVDRTANTVDSIAFASTALTWNANTLFTTANDGSGSGLDADLLDGLNSSAYGQLAAANAWSNNNSFSANVLISSTGPTFRLNETDAAADNRLWDAFVNTEQLQLRVVDDAISSGVAYFTVNRTANVVDSIALASTALTWNANTLFTTANDGAGSGLDADLLDGISSAAFAEIANTETISAVWTYNAIPAFNGGTSGSTAPFSVDSTQVVTNLNADLLDGVSEASFAQLAQTETVSAVWTYSAIPAFDGGTSGASAPFTVDSTQVVTNLNADLLDGLSEAIFAQLAQAETVTAQWAFNGGTSGASAPFTVDSTDVVTNLNADTVDGAHYETGTFTLNFGTACTTTPSITYDYVRIGNMVTLKVDSSSGFPCTGDATGFSSGAVPAALIPTDNAISPMFGDGSCQDNATTVPCGMSISGGLGLMNITDCTGGIVCNATGWQAAGNRSGPANGVTWTYTLGDP